MTIGKDQDKELRKIAADSLVHMVVNLEGMINKYLQKGQTIIHYSDSNPQSEENKQVFARMEKYVIMI